ncbi:hypothetical protein [Bacillus sp. USDA818B3_A]|uniref:hypothetical protein n=1 Tax=Bacillus sp. USDA818B3_A TaxID=2698834 RepID=UPI00136E4252|nr:hypothetical protein [Bacillus sp. USDA818B3_A]
MKLEMQKATMLAENINDFIKYVQKNHKYKNSLRFNPDKLYQVNLFVEEFRFQIIADELLRINKYSWDAKYTFYLVDSFIKGLDTIEEYVRNNYEDLYLLTARLYILSDLSRLFTRTEIQA